MESFYVIQSDVIIDEYGTKKSFYVKMNDSIKNRLSYTLTFEDADTFKDVNDNVIELWRRAKRNFAEIGISNPIKLTWRIMKYTKEEYVI